ncbi:MAG: hypothetical protein JNM17_24430 [Archangium sp.]|nr:hypothetical protein [Archangium sp.]
MNRRFWLGFLAYLLPTFPLGYVWHLVVFKTTYEQLELFRDDVIIPFGLLSMTIQGLLFSWLFPRVTASAASPVQGAVRFFALASVLAWSFTTLPVAAKYRMASVSGFMAIETGFTLAQYAIVVPLLALAWRGAVLQPEPVRA